MCPVGSGFSTASATDSLHGSHERFIVLTTLRIVADTPSTHPGLGFEVYAEALAGAIRGGTPPQFTIGIYGAWGSGKSSLLHAVANQLAQDETVLPVMFDAWRYERADHVVVPLLNAVLQASAALNDDRLSDKIKNAVLSVTRACSFNLGFMTFDPGKVSARTTDERHVSLTQLDDAFVKPYADMREIAVALDGRRIAVLIDDLDRCSPANVVSLLEAINLTMDVPGFVFVLALDYAVLVNAVNTRYPHTSGHVFIEKMVQVPFRVPRLNLHEETFLNDLIPDWDAHAGNLPENFTQVALEVCSLGLEANPRQIKRFINSVTVLSYVSKSTSPQMEIETLAGVVGLQLRWPAEYQDLADAVFAGDADPTQSILTSDDVRLARYGKRFFGAGVFGSALSDVVNLTQTVATAEPVGASRDSATATPGPAAVLRVDHRRQIQEVLLNTNFEVSSRSPDVYVSTTVDGLRVAFGQTVVRFEARSVDGRWILAISYLLTRDHQKAIWLLSKHDALRKIRDLTAKQSSSSSQFVKTVAKYVE